MRLSLLITIILSCSLGLAAETTNTATVYAITFKAVRVGCLEYEQ